MDTSTRLGWGAALVLALGMLSCSGGGATLDLPSDPGSGPGVLPPSGGGNASAQVLALEDEAFALVNDERTVQGRVALFHDDGLRGVARAHSEDMVTRAFFAHVNPDGDSPFDRMAAAGISFQRAGENIAWNRGFADPAATAVDGWMNSDGHRANILDDRFTATGMGVAEAADGAWYFTQVFTLPSGDLVLRSWLSRSHGDAGGSWAESH